MANIQNHQKIYSFIQHCCQSSHYTFDILKCGDNNCALCKPVRLPKEVFDKIKHISLPKPGADGHYFPFPDLLGQPITEEYRPPLQQKAKEETPVFLCKCAACEECTTNGAVRRVSNVALDFFKA